jgi:Zn-dependent protease with chaperone function
VILSLHVRCRRILLGMYLVLIFSASFGQIPAFYTALPLVTESAEIKTIIETGHQKSKSLLPQRFENTKTANYTKEQMKKRQEFLLSLLESGDFIVGTTINKYVEFVFQSILQANPQLDQTMSVLVSRNPRPNAFNTGDNIVVVHLGLLERLNNEAELGFVLAHEMAHQSQSHVMTNLISRASLYYSDSTQAAIAKIKRSEYFVVSQLNNFFLPGMRSTMSFSRNEEFQADSIGFRYFENAGYDKKHALSLIQILATFDTDRDTTALNYKKIFSHPNYPYNDRWDYVEEISSLGTFETDEEYEEDLKKLQTHPDTPLRLERIKKTTSLVSSPTLNPQDSATSRLVLDVRLQIMNDHISRLNYGKAIHQLGYLITDYPDSPYLKYKLAYYLTLLALDKKTRTFGKHVDLKDLDYSNSYNTTLNMLWEMRSSELLDLAYHHIQDFTEADITSNAHILGLEALIAYHQSNIDTYQGCINKYNPTTIEAELATHLTEVEHELDIKNKKRK